MNQRLILPLYGVWMAVLGVVYFWIASASVAVAVWALIGLSGAAAVVAGERLHRPRRRFTWYLMAAAVVGYTCGDVIFYLNHGFPTGLWHFVEQLIYITSFMLLLVALFRLVRLPGPGATIDALIVLCGLGLLTAMVLIESGAALDPDIEELTRFGDIAYPLADVVIVAAVARIAAGIRWNPSVGFFLAAAVGLLASDMVYELSSLDPVAADLGAFGWFAFYACWGASALTSGMRLLSEPPSERPRPPSVFSLVLLGLSLAIPPIVLVYEALADASTVHTIAIASVSLIMFALVLTRVANVGGKLRLRTEREVRLRDVMSTLVSATDHAEVAAALDIAASELLPLGTRYHTVLLRAEDTPVRLRSMSTSDVLATGELPPELADRFSTFPAVLVCPLVAVGQQPREPFFGLLLVASEANALYVIRDSMAALSAQVALALDRVHLNQELLRRKNEEYFRTLVHNTADVILILDGGDRVRYASPSAAAMFGTESIAGTPMLELVDDADRPAAAAALAALHGVGAQSDGEAGWTVRGPDGPPIQVEASWRDLRADPSVHGVVLTLRDVTEQRRLEQELTHRAYHDELTGLPNRAMFTERIRQGLARTRDGQRIIGVLLVDLDDFKTVNDTLGHEQGDRLLVAVSHRLAELLRDRDMAARLGGDEFAVIIDDAREPGDVEQVAARIVAALRMPFLLDGEHVDGSASIGASTSVDASNGRELFRHADVALYSAKGEGKGQYRIYRPDLHNEVTDRLTLRAELSSAISAGQLFLEYQPIVMLESGMIGGFEALVRWNHPTRGRLMPDRFIDIAEESGLVVPMGQWVLRTAIEAACNWARRRPRPQPYVSVNVSVWQFRHPGFANRVLADLRACGLAPSSLMLEMTESLMLREDEQVWQDLARLRRAGVRIAIDDFGTGYSSLSYLRQVPLDVLKIDRLFTSTIATSARQRDLLEGIVRLAGTLRLQVIAEGVETEEQRELLTRIGCGYGQGYLFARPLPLEQTAGWLERGATEGRRAV